MNFYNKNNLFFFILFLLLAIFIVDYFSENSFILNPYFLGISNNSYDLMDNCESILEVSFCPKDDCLNKLLNEINSANKTIDLAIYSFTLDEVADSLISAKNRGVRVRVVFDYLQSFNAYSVDEKLMSGGIPVLKKGKGSWGSMHNKFIIIDNEKVLTGSFNYSRNAIKRNNENLLLIVDENVISYYLKEFNYLWFDLE